MVTMRFRAGFGFPVCLLARPQPAGQNNIKVKLIVLRHLPRGGIGSKGLGRPQQGAPDHLFPTPGRVSGSLQPLVSQDPGPGEGGKHDES